MVQGLIHLAIELVIVGLIYWILTFIPMPAPFQQILRVIFIVIAVIIVLAFLLPLAGLHLGLAALLL